MPSSTWASPATTSDVTLTDLLSKAAGVGGAVQEHGSSGGGSSKGIDKRKKRRGHTRSRRSGSLGSSREADPTSLSSSKAGSGGGTPGQWPSSMPTPRTSLHLQAWQKQVLNQALQVPSRTPTAASAKVAPVPRKSQSATTSPRVAAYPLSPRPAQPPAPTLRSPRSGGSTRSPTSSPRGRVNCTWRACGQPSPKAWAHYLDGAHSHSPSWKAASPPPTNSPGHPFFDPTPVDLGLGHAAAFTTISILPAKVTSHASHAAAACSVRSPTATATPVCLSKDSAMMMAMLTGTGLPAGREATPTGCFHACPTSQVHQAAQDSLAGAEVWADQGRAVAAPCAPAQLQSYSLDSLAHASVVSIADLARGMLERRSSGAQVPGAHPAELGNATDMVREEDVEEAEAEEDVEEEEEGETVQEMGGGGAVEGLQGLEGVSVDQDNEKLSSPSTLDAATMVAGCVCPTPPDSPPARRSPWKLGQPGGIRVLGLIGRKKGSTTAAAAATAEMQVPPAGPASTEAYSQEGGGAGGWPAQPALLAGLGGSSSRP